MLVIKRKRGESVILCAADGGHPSIVTVLDYDGGKITLGITAPHVQRAERVKLKDMPPEIKGHYLKIWEEHQRYG